MDRIDELFTQAGGYIEIDKDGNRWTYSQECDPDTFAELIIKECGKVMESYDPDFDWAARALEKHFWSNNEN